MTSVRRRSAVVADWKKRGARGAFSAFGWTCGALVVFAAAVGSAVGLAVVVGIAPKSAFAAAVLEREVSADDAGAIGGNAPNDAPPKTDSNANRTTAAIGSATLKSVRVGLEGVYRSGAPTQVVVEWDGDVERVELETVDSDGTPFLSEKRLSADERAAKRAETTFVFPKATGKLTVRLFDASNAKTESTFAPTPEKRSNGVKRTTAETPTGESSESAEDAPNVVFRTPAPASKPIYLVVGNADLGVDSAFAELRWKEERRPNVVEVERLADLPTDFRALESVERLILTTTEPEFFAGATSDDPRLAAIERWVERGGNVVLLAGPKSVPLLSEGGALSRLSPGAAVAARPHEFRVVNALIAELDGVKNLAMTGTRAYPFLNAPVLTELKPDSVVEMREAETPLLVARPVGLGTVVYFAADLAEPPFSNWSGRGRLWLKILNVDAERSAAKPVATQFVKRGYDDLSGQLRSALDVFDGVRVVPFAFALVLIFVYLLLIGPLDWFLAKKVFKKPVATWATFPIYVVGFCVLVVWATRATRPNEPRLNEADSIDVDWTTGVVRGASWFGLYSPVDRRYDLRFGPGATFGRGSKLAAVDAETAVSFLPLTLDGAGIGGAEQKTVSLRAWDAPYSLREAETGASATVGNDSAAAAVAPVATAEIVGVPTQTRSSKSFVGRWSSKLTGLPAPGVLVDDGLSLRGTVVNPFDVPIYSAFVLYPGGAYSLGTLAPGETPIEKLATRLETRRVLNEHRSSVPTDRAASFEGTAYNLESTRIPYILRTASFYRFGGGEETFGVAKRLQGDLDLSDLFRCGRAVVFGTIVDPEAETYRPTDEVRKTADAADLERLNKKLAEQRGETIRNASEEAIEKFGAFGSSDSFVPTAADWATEATAGAADRSRTPSGKRTVVVRLVVPLTRGAAPTSETSVESGSQNAAEPTPAPDEKTDATKDAAKNEPASATDFATDGATFESNNN